MLWEDRAAWVYKDSMPDIEKLRNYAIKTIYVDPRSSNAKAAIQTSKDNGLAAGIYVASSWFAGVSPKEFVSVVSGWIGKLIPQAYPLPTQTKGAPVMLDLEAVPKQWQAEVINEYRRVRPSRETAYTNEAFQDGTVVPIDELVAHGFHWYPQVYQGDMTPVDPAAVVLECARWGFPVSRLHPFYDGANLYARWRDGCVFTMERLP